MAGGRDRQPRPAPKRAAGRPALLDLQIPFFRPLWRRVVLVAVLFVWVGLELVFGGPFWAMLAGGIGLFAAYEFFVAFDPQDAADASDAGRDESEEEDRT